MSDKTDIALDYPITIDGAKVAILAMRRPKVADILAAQKLKGDEAEREVRIMANLCDVTPADIQNLDLADYTKLQETFAGFRGRRSEASVAP